MVPRLRVRKDWYQGLQADPIDHSHLDVGQAPDAQEAFDAAAIIRVGFCIVEAFFPIFLLCLFFLAFAVFLGGGGAGAMKLLLWNFRVFIGFFHLYYLVF